MSRNQRPVVTNTGPIIALASIGRLDLLGELFHEIVVPKSVNHEVVIQGAGRSGAKELRDAAWVRVVGFEPPFDALLAEELGRG